MSEIVFVDGKFQTAINGKIVRRSYRPHLEYALRKAKEEGLITTTESVNVEDKPSFSAIERLSFIAKFVDLLATGSINSFILTGSGGMGKTTSVLNELNLLGMVEDTPNEPTGDFMVVRGFSTPRALYEMLYQYRNKILVLDDSDDVFKNPLGANLLKACLDDKPERVVNWNTSVESEIPNRFVYTGKMIFISNMSINQFPQALISRSHKVDLTLTADEKVDIIGEVFKNKPGNDTHKAEVFQFVKEYAHKAKDLNIRSALNLLVLRENFGNDWQRIAAYSFCN